MSKTRQLGYFCSLVPEEIMLAAGLKPVRIEGQAQSTSAADGYLYPNLCPYIKNVVSTALDGKLKNLAGVAFARSCDGMRRMYDIWRTYIDTGYVYMLEVPKNNDGPAVEYYASQLRHFARSLEEGFSVKISAAALRKAIKQKNVVRRLMWDILTLQQSHPLPIAGSELFELGRSVLHSAGSSEVKKLREYHQRAWTIKSAGGNSRVTRVLISGSVMDRPDMFELLEAAGAEVPVADLCTDLRYFKRNVDETIDDPYLALAQAYLGEPHCSRTASPVERVEEIKKLVREYSIDGVLLTSLKYCDHHLYDVPYITKNLIQSGIPVLFLENDYTFTNKSQLKVRIEAFIEVLQDKKEFSHA